MIGLLDKVRETILDKFHSISLLFIRLLLAYGFYEPAMNKWKDIDKDQEDKKKMTFWLKKWNDE